MLKQFFEHILYLFSSFRQKPFDNCPGKIINLSQKKQTHKRNKQSSSTAENAQESGNIDYECVAGEFLGTKWK